MTHTPRGVGRPPKDGQKNRERIDVRLPPQMVAWLKRNGTTQIIETAIKERMDEMNEYQKQNEAVENRLREIGFNSGEIANIIAWWATNARAMAENHGWLMSATAGEIREASAEALA